MSCEFKNREQQIDDFLQGKLSSVEAEALEIHVFNCTECLDELRLREQMIALIKEERVTAVAERVRPQRAGLRQSIRNFFRLQPNAWIYAGAAAIFFVALLAARFFFKPETTEQNETSFAESPYLESVMKQTFQSTGVSVSVISPTRAENFTDEVRFRWEAQKDGEPFRVPLDLKIMNNQGTPVLQVKIETNEYILKQPLPRGLYYWTLLEEQGQQLYLGKFFFKKPTR